MSSVPAHDVVDGFRRGRTVQIQTHARLTLGIDNRWHGQDAILAVVYDRISRGVPDDG